MFNDWLSQTSGGPEPVIIEYSKLPLRWKNGVRVPQQSMYGNLMLQNEYTETDVHSGALIGGYNISGCFSVCVLAPGVVKDFSIRQVLYELNKQTRVQILRDMKSMQPRMYLSLSYKKGLLFGNTLSDYLG